VVDTQQRVSRLARAVFCLMRLLGLKHWLAKRAPFRESAARPQKQRAQGLRLYGLRLHGLRVVRLDVGGFPLYLLSAGAAAPDKAVFFIHGGGFVMPPLPLHWHTATMLARRTGAAVYFVRYPLFPEAGLAQIYDHVAAAFDAARRDFGGRLQAVWGDSAGATLALSLASRLAPDVQPGRFIALSPCADASFSNPDAEARRDLDLLLPWDTVKTTAQRMLLSVKNEDVSPLFFSYENLRRSGARLTLCIGGRDILYPDTERLHRRLLAEGIAHDYWYREDMIHVWPYMPLVPESRADMRRILRLLRSDGAGRTMDNGQWRAARPGDAGKSDSEQIGQ
jgi:acetyl esterase/lipase